jgi:hypothetical protein
MVKGKRPSYMSPRNLLTKKEYQQYSTLRKIPERDRLQKEWNQRKKDFKKYSQEKRYEESRTGKVASRVSSFLRGIKRTGRVGATRSLYKRKTSPYNRPMTQPTKAQGYTGRGRPRGSFDSRYAQYGGVYGYRKAMAQQRWKERREILERSVTNPRQRAIFQQIQQREEMRLRSPESRTIPDTAGQVPTKSIMDEINDATNIFP